MKGKTSKKWLSRAGVILLSVCLLCSEHSIVNAMNGKEATGSESEPVITSIEFGEPIVEEAEEEVLDGDFVYDSVTVEANELTYKPFSSATYELTYTIGYEGITITGYVGDETNQQLILPEEIDGVKVVRIEEYAFKYCSGFTGSLKIPDSVTSIGKYAFYGCSGFTGNLEIPDSVTSIGTHAFEDCSGFTGDLEIPDSVNSIGEYAFRGCSGFTGDLVISDSVTTIERRTFSDCSGFTGNLEIPDSVNSIGEYAFYGCSGFTGSLKIPDSVTNIGSGAFSGCSGFTGDLVIPDSVTNIGSSAFSGCSGFTGDLVIPDSVISIGSSAFSGCSGFTGSLEIPDSVTSIGSYAFSGCSGFKGDLEIPDSVTSIGSYAFRDCSGFKGDLEIPDSVTSIYSGAFYGCSGFTGSLKIPDSVNSIGEHAFYGCSGFTGSLEIPDSVTSIGRYAFSGCSGFTGSLEIPNSVTSIGSDAFSGCSGFTGDLVIPDSVTYIEWGTFVGCSGFTGSLEIPDSVTSIGMSAFGRCSGFTGDLEIPDSVISIDSYAFSGCSGFTGDLVIPDSVTSIGEYAFSGCSGLSRRIYFNTVNDASTYNLSSNSFLIKDKNSDTTIYGIPGTYIETYALENGYTFADGSDFFEEWENKRKEEESLQPLPDDYEDEIIITEDKFCVLVLDEEGEPIEGAYVNVWDNYTLEEWKNEKTDDYVRYITDARGVAYIEEVSEICVISIFSSGRASKTSEVEPQNVKKHRVRLKKNSAKVSVLQVYCTGSDNKSVSLLENDMHIQENDSTTYKVWIQTENVFAEDVDAVYLMQGDTTLASSAWEEDNSGTITVKWGEKLSDNGKAVYVVGKKDGTTVFIREIQIKLISEEWTKLITQTPEISVGSSFSPDVNNEDVPAIWGKGDLEFNTLVELPLKIEYEKNKIKVYVGGSEKYVDKEKNFTKAEILKAIEEKINTEKNTTDIPVYPCVAVGFDVDLEAGGYLEGEFYPEQDGVNVTGAIVIKLTGTVKGTLQPKVCSIELPVQIYLKGELSDQVTGKVELSFVDGKLVNAGPYEVENELEFMISLGGLLGYEDWWEYRAEGGIGINWTHSFANSAEPNVVKLKGKAEVSRTFLGFTKVYWYWPEKEGQGEIKIYPTQKQGDRGIERMADTGYELLGRDYLLTNRLTGDSAGSTVIEGVYPYCEPMLVEANGVQYLFYINDMAGREAADRTALVYRTNSGSGWSSEMVVSEDGTADFAYDVLAVKEGIHVLWQNATGSLVAAGGPEDAAAKLELQTALVKGSTVSDVCTLESSEGKYPFSPDLFLSDGKIQVGWYENSENDVLSEGKGTNTFYVQAVGASTKTVLAESDYFMGSAVFGEFGGKTCAVFSADIDGSLSTMEDREIMVADESCVRSLTFNAVLDSCPKFVELGGKQYVMYYSGGGLVMTDGEAVQTVMETDGYASDSFLVTGEGETAVVVWRDAYSINSEIQSIYMAEYKNGMWSTKGSILDTEESLRAFYLCGGTDGAELVYVTGNRAGEQEITGIHMKKANPKGRVELTSLTYDADSYVPGQTFPVSLELTDRGEVTAEEIVVRMLKEDGSVAWEKTLTDLPVAGGSVEVNVTDFVPKNTAEVKEYRLSIICDGTENACEVIQLGGVDLSVSHEISYEENDRMLDVQIKNDSKIAGNVTLTIQTEEATPVTLVQKNYENISGGSRVYYYCKLEKLLEQADGKNLLIKVESDSEERTYINNETIVFNYLTEAPKVSVSVQENGSDVSELAIETGESRHLKAVLTGENTDGVTVSWTSSNPACVSVESTGKITALSEGVVRVTATTSEGVEASVKVTVTKAEVLATGITLSESNLTMIPEGRAVLKATVLPAEVTDPMVTWSSNKESVVKVEDGVLLAIGEGTAVITAETVNGLKASCNVTVKKERTEVIFADIEEDSWKYSAAVFVYNRGVMTGKGITKEGYVIFAPDDNLSRQEFAQILYSAEGKPTVPYKPIFSDVKDGQWYTSAILWAAEKGIVSGYNNGKYGVDDNITREQLAAMLYKYAVYKGYDTAGRAELDQFEDADKISDWAMEQLKWAVANGVMSGKGTKLDPTGNATRAECAAMVRTFMVKFEK